MAPVNLDKLSNELEKSTQAYLLLAVTEKGGVHIGYKMDQGDALMFINYVVRDFNLDPDSVAFACKKWLEEQREPKKDGLM